MKILVLIDDPTIREGFRNIISVKQPKDLEIDYKFSYYEKFQEEENLKPIDIAKSYKDIMNNYNLIFSLCSQIFPQELVEKVRCINFHFGILPYACGVTPITFSIINNIPVGYTIHLMDKKIDHGDIIYQEEVEACDTDTAKNVLVKCQKSLLLFLSEHILDLIYSKYTTRKQQNDKRRYFSLNDFNNLLSLNLEKQVKIKDFITLLRALNIDGKTNAYYISSNKEYIDVSINIRKKKTNE